MKKIMMFIILIVIIVFGYFFLKKDSTIYDLLKDVESDEFYITKYSIYGTHMNIDGCIEKTLEGNVSLVLKNKDEEIVIDSNFSNEDNKTCFSLSEKYNDGLYLDDLKIGNFLLLVKVDKDSDISYYTLNNKTEYKNLEYYTITKNNSNNKIDIVFDKYKKKNYLEFKIKEENLPSNVYDITIDPGHGGRDVGASGKLNSTTHYEADLTLKISMLLKSELEDLGLKVKMTREDDIKVDPYGEGGRALIPNEVNSKYSLSIHLNSASGTMTYGGVEVYTPNDINLDLATLLSNNISNVVGYSKKTTDKISKGIYYTYFTKKDIEESKEEMLKEDMKPYDIKEGSPYMYMIREVGGIHTGAYIDGRNDYYGLNNYYNSNQTAEPYLLELAYINYSKDLKTLVNNPEKFSHAISSALKEYLNIS